MYKLFTPKEASSILKINYRKVLELIHLKKLPAIQIEKQFRIKESDLYAFIEDRML